MADIGWLQSLTYEQIAEIISGKERRIADTERANRVARDMLAQACSDAAALQYRGLVEVLRICTAHLAKISAVEGEFGVALRDLIAAVRAEATAAERERLIAVADDIVEGLRRYENFGGEAEMVRNALVRAGEEKQ